MAVARAVLMEGAGHITEQEDLGVGQLQVLATLDTLLREDLIEVATAGAGALDNGHVTVGAGARCWPSRTRRCVRILVRLPQQVLAPWTRHSGGGGKVHQQGVGALMAGGRAGFLQSVF